MNEHGSPEEQEQLAVWQELRQHSELLREAAALRAELDELAAQKALRETYSPELVRATLTLLDVRAKAVVKFSRPDQLWATSKLIEQATPELIATHKARRFANCSQVFDQCCGLGSDAIAMARHANVTAVDTSAISLQCCRWNAELYEVADHIETLQSTAEEVSVKEAYVHIDPDQRANASGRTRRVEHLQPSLEYLQGVTREAKGGAIKLSPASNFGGKFEDVEIELISLNGECKEATIWFGDLAEQELWRATALPSGETIYGHPLDALAERSALGTYLLDPDPAIVRSGLVDLLCETHDLRRLDDSEEYLTTDALPTTSFVTTFEVLEELPNNERKLNKAVTKYDWGDVEIKSRHLPVDAVSIRKRLSLNGSARGTIFFCRIQGRSRIVLARRVTSE
ncbi:class I SAM-dependent methyltransferase [Calycomorphotria hydatis]|uniref:RNA cap guanine-N2 methyltransferase n=1 Tax=Calycomorphotria hydatis TaxID=2528027 RepID=A0A517T9F3_9PLAN|nr:hypothetical protein [Calycomorphotria hydatis]QDT65010.1 RNA cap guanine-N2 methyltransferase [Calycomorphotria hydatis]